MMFFIAAFFVLSSPEYEEPLWKGECVQSKHSQSVYDLENFLFEKGKFKTLLEISLFYAESGDVKHMKQVAFIHGMMSVDDGENRIPSIQKWHMAAVECGDEGAQKELVDALRGGSTYLGVRNDKGLASCIEDNYGTKRIMTLCQANGKSLDILKK